MVGRKMKNQGEFECVFIFSAINEQSAKIYVE